MIQVKDTTFVETGRDSSRNPIGTVWVKMAEPRFQSDKEFHKIDARDYFNWRMTGHGYSNVPYDMLQQDWSAWIHRLESRIHAGRQYDIDHGYLPGASIDAADLEDDSLELAAERRKRMFKQANDAVQAQLGDREYNRRYGHGRQA